jgi:CBS domain-containing protein
VPTAIFRDEVRAAKRRGSARGCAAAGEGAFVRPQAPVEEAMRNGPATFRPNEPVGKMAKRMQDRGATAVLVTTSDGRLAGLLYREDVEHLAGANT